MIDHLGLGRLAVLLVVALLVFGPDRLPEIAGQVGRALRQFRKTLDGMSAEVRESVGPEIANMDLKAYHPRTLLTTLMEDEPETMPVDLQLHDEHEADEETERIRAELDKDVDLSGVDSELAAMMQMFPAVEVKEQTAPAPIHSAQTGTARLDDIELSA